MAILRGGVRIGGFDIRLGLPRDRSLENVANDPRFNEKPFPVSADNISDDPRFSETKNRNLRGRPTSETTMGRVQSYVNQAEGFARKARFYVEFNLPRPGGGGITGTRDDDGGETRLSQSSQEEILSFKSNNDMVNYQNNNGRRVNAFCKSIIDCGIFCEISIIHSFIWQPVVSTLNSGCGHTLGTKILKLKAK
jgi:hypothetical protein